MTRPRQHIQHDLLCLKRPGVCLCASSMYSMYAHTCNTHVNARARAHTARAEQTHSCKDLVRLHVRTCTRTRTHTRCIHAHTLNVNESPRPVSCAPTVMIKSSLPTASSCLPGPHVYMYVCRHIYIHIYIYMHLTIHTYIYIHIYTHIYTYIHISRFLRRPRATQDPPFALPVAGGECG